MFRAYDAERERLVAVKLFNLDLPPEKGHQLVAEFERLIAAQLTHPGLAAPLATGITGVSAYLAQDYVAAESLDLAVREYGSAPPADALRVAAQLAGALDFAAVVNISHGALHPRDVLMSSDDTRLTGIGVARALEVVGVTAPVRRPYTPPERIAGAAWDRRADVFSLAALVHELLWARRVSGSGAHAADGLTEIEGGDLVGLRATFARALAEDPRERFETALEFAEALKDAFPAVQLTPPAVVDRRTKRSRSGATPQPRTLNPEPPAVIEVEPRLPLDLGETEPPPVEAAAEFDIGEVFTKQSETPDLDLRSAEAVRFDEAPAGLADAPARFDESPARGARIEPDMEPRRAPQVAQFDPPLAALPAPASVPYEPELLSVLERSRSAVWPLVLALVVGIAMGFAGGYGIGTQRQNASGSSAGGREFTEGAVAEPAKVPDEAPVKPTDPGSVRLQPDRVTPPPPAPRPAPPVVAERLGDLLIRSTPAGAHLFVDGRDAGITPAALRDLPHGSHRIRVTHEGYVASERRVVITKGNPAQSIALTLARDRSAEPRAAQAPAVATAARSAANAGGPSAGPLQVESRPPGASVFLDGKLVGTTPVSLPVVTAGDHAIRLERDGYLRWSSSVRIVATEQNRVTASLER